MLRDVRIKTRTTTQKLLDFVTFPLRAITLFHEDKWGLSSLASERFDYVSREVVGSCLDVGCGRHNRFVNEYLNGHGKGIDVFPYEGLTEVNIVTDLTTFPYQASSFESVTFIANINHVPKSKRDAELREAYRVLMPSGNIVVTMGNPLAEIAVHRVVWLHDKLFKTNHDMDNERGMDAEEEYYLTDSEIVERLARAGFAEISKKYFWTQWGLNHLFIGWKT
jgi:ubiquinone/menaquinone biosynthesis C-methylase UbiE